MDDVRRAEEALVGAVVLAPDRLAEVAVWLHRTDFGSPTCGLLYERLLQVHRAGPDPTGARLLDVLRERGELRADGYPVSALTGWLDALPARPQVGVYGALVVEGALGRQLEATGTRLCQVSNGRGATRALITSLTQQAALAAALRRWWALPAAVRTTTDPVRTTIAPVRTAARPDPMRTAVRSLGAVRSDEIPSSDGEHAEWVAVGSLLVVPYLSGRVSWLEPEDFCSPDLARVFAAVREMTATGGNPDRVTVAAELRRRGALPADGDWDGVLRRAVASVPVPSAVGFYGRQVLDTAALSRVGQVGHRLFELGRTRPGGAAAMLEVALGELAGLDNVRARLRRSRVLPVRRSAPGPERPAMSRTAARQRPARIGR